MLAHLYRGECACIEAETRLFLRDCYDHTVQILYFVESYRDMTSSMLEVYLSSVSNRLNESMRVLTVIATIFIPLTFIAGVYGMNFGVNTTSWWAMPELRWAYGYPAVWVVMILIAAGLLYAFKRRNWFEGFCRPSALGWDREGPHQRDRPIARVDKEDDQTGQEQSLVQPYRLGQVGADCQQAGEEQEQERVVPNCHIISRMILTARSLFSGVSQ